MAKANKKNKILSRICIEIALLLVIVGMFNLVKSNLETLEQEWVEEVWEDYEFE